MSTQIAQTATNASNALNAECTECAAKLHVAATLPGEILDCAQCGAELEVRSVHPLALAVAPQVEEDWGE